MSRDQARRRRVVIVAFALVVLVGVAPVWGSMFGEENTTLVHMLVQLLQIESDMGELNKVAGEAADTANTLLTTYQQVNAGINTLKSYSFDTFLNDVKVDLYRQYPGFAKLRPIDWKYTSCSNRIFTICPNSSAYCPIFVYSICTTSTRCSKIVR